MSKTYHTCDPKPSLLKEIPISDKKYGEVGNVYFYSKIDSKEGNNKRNLILVDEYIKTIPIKTTQKVLLEIKRQIKLFETKWFDTYSDELNSTITQIDDVTFCLVNIGKWRKGSGYVYLQLSNKNNGNARLVAYATDTIFHSSNCLGKLNLDVNDMEKIIKEYLSNKERVKIDIERLKYKHETLKTADELLASLIS